MEKDSTTTMIDTNTPFIILKLIWSNYINIVVMKERKCKKKVNNVYNGGYRFLEMFI